MEKRGVNHEFTRFFALNIGGFWALDFFCDPLCGVTAAGCGLFYWDEFFKCLMTLNSWFVFPEFLSVSLQHDPLTPCVTSYHCPFNPHFRWSKRVFQTKINRWFESCSILIIYLTNESFTTVSIQHG